MIETDQVAQLLGVQVEESAHAAPQDELAAAAAPQDELAAAAARIKELEAANVVLRSKLEAAEASGQMSAHLPVERHRAD